MWATNFVVGSSVIGGTVGDITLDFIRNDITLENEVTDTLNEFNLSENATITDYDIRVKVLAAGLEDFETAEFQLKPYISNGTIKYSPSTLLVRPKD